MLQSFEIGMQIEEPYATITIPGFFGKVEKLLGMRVVSIEQSNKGSTTIHLENNKHYIDRNTIKIEEENES